MGGTRGGRRNDARGRKLRSFLICGEIIFRSQVLMAPDGPERCRDICWWYLGFFVVLFVVCGSIGRIASLAWRRPRVITQLTEFECRDIKVVGSVETCVHGLFCQAD